jgi:uncharacterized protein YdiU (UPF0061 family)
MKNFKLNTTQLDKLDKRFYDLSSASPLQNPHIVSLNHMLLNELGFKDVDFESDDFLGFLNGNYTASGSIAYASAYSGHQFGYFVPNLGDGRALNLGSNSGYHLQLKGSGVTKYSREGDGRAVLRSSIREYLVSEAMHALGIPTTRALALIASETKVYRQTKEQAAMTLRASSSWVRFGTFEFASLGDKKLANVTMLADFVIDESFKELKELPNRYEKLYFSIVDKTAELIAQWQSVGFMHGVMNTDNMSIEGLTIDYGPFAFMEIFKKDFVCNSSDYDGRYSFEAQPYIAQWNLSVLLRPFSLIADKNVMDAYLDTFIGKYKLRYFDLMGKKLGLYKPLDEDKNLISELLKALEEDRIDYTNFFYKLSMADFENLSKLGSYTKEWINSYKSRLELEDDSEHIRVEKMRATNPKYVLKNHMLQDAIDKAQLGDFTLVDALLKIAQNPYAEHEEYEHYADASKPDDIFICSCSS